MEIIKSKFSNDTIYWGCIALIILLPAGIIFNFKIFAKFYNEGFNSLGDILLSALFILIFIFTQYYLEHIRYIVIKENTLKYYSLLRPFGKTLYFNDFIGKIETKENFSYGSYGSYNVIYLVDKNNRTCFKIIGLHYKKFGTIYNAIPLNKIIFYPNTLQNLKLIFGINIYVENIEKTITEKRLVKHFNYFIIGFYAFAILAFIVIFILVGIMKLSELLN
jgi:hypothetical protein